MKEVLFISYHFPPIGASIRPLKYVKYLPQFGWKPIILAPERSNYVKVDSKLVEEISQECEVVRLPSCEKYPGNPYIITEDFIMGWFPSVIMEGLRIIETKKIDVIYCVAAPYVTLLAGLTLKRLTGIPLVIDLRDEWTTNPFIQERRWEKNIPFNRKMEALVLKEADAVISVTAPITETYHQLSGITAPDKFYTLTNGYDPDDFDQSETPKRNRKFTVCYMGSIYGLIKGVVDLFFKNLEIAFQENKLSTDDIEIKLVGHLDHIQFPQSWKVNEAITRTGFVDHQTALRHAMSSDLLLLFIDQRQGDQTVTSKIFELINMEKPILAVVPPNGTAAKVIDETRTGIVIDSRLPRNAIPPLLGLMEDWKQDKLSINPNKVAIKKYSWSVITRRLALIMNKAQKG